MYSYSEIIGLNAETIWFGSIFAIKLMLGRFEEWEFEKLLDDVDSMIPSDLAKTISFWHERTLIPVTDYIRTIHKPPSFARTVLENLSEFKNEKSPVFELHVRILCSASEELVQCYNSDGGRQAAAAGEIEKWFLVLKRAAKELQPHVTCNTANLLNETIESFDVGENANATSSYHANEHVLFCHKFLFLRIAHMVELYTNAKRGVHYDAYAALKVSGRDMKRWGHVSGNLIQNLFNNDINGLPMIETHLTRHFEKYTNEGKFQYTLIDCLPYKEFAEETQKNNGVPSLLELQESVICKMFGKIRIHAKYVGEMSTTTQLTLLAKLFSMTIFSSDKSKQILRNREKVRKCLRNKKKQNQNHNHSPQRHSRRRNPNSPDIFQWDTFVMGKNSYFHHFREFNGAALRHFYWKCNMRGTTTLNFDSEDAV